MEKKLLLLGYLRHQDMHGYQLNEMLAERAATSIVLSRANAYKLLKQMERDGWVTCREERAGNWPTRRVYSVTLAGEVAFQALLRESVSGYQRPEFPSLVSLNFLAELPPAEAEALLVERRARVDAQRAQLGAAPEEMRRAHLSVEYLHRFLQAERLWLDEIISHLREESA